MDFSFYFYCKFCNHKAQSVNGHLHHIKVHRNISKYIYCGLGHCLRSFRTESSLRSHLIRNHQLFCSHHAKRPAPRPPNENGKFICRLEFCHQEFHDCRSLMAHLKSHLSSGIKIPCPYADCLKTFTSSSSLTGHVSKKHRIKDTAHSGTCSEPVDLFVLEEPCNSLPEECEIVKESNLDESLVALAQFYQKLEYKHMVPATVTQTIAVELKTLITDMNRTFLNKVATVLGNEKLPASQISDILASVIENNDVLQVCNALRTVYMRKNFYADAFSFIEPELVALDNGSFYYYVPIDKCIAAAFKNKNWSFRPMRPNPTDNGVLKDFTDGETYKKNTFFIENANAIPLILYQDGFELVCPIGPAKNMKHKLEGIYMAFGNLPSHLRFQKDSIQLVALCKKSDFSYKEVYDKLTKELIKLQVEGVEIPNIGNVKAGLAFIAGDNLGSHALGGFLENFSRAIYFCRYCLVKRQQFTSNGGETRPYKRRTIESYEDAVTKVTVTPSGEIKTHKGVKFDSPFNLVHGFHVCAPALPPCLGHDLCEGVVAHDLKLFIQYFIKNKWFSLNILNGMVEKFPYSQEDVKDKPPIIKKLEKSRLAGGAWQIFVFLRLFPLIVHGHVKNDRDPVWKLLLQLREICEIAVAPEIHVSYIALFQCAINEYLVSRKELFPSKPLRPKHHFMHHYPELILSFGPLIKVWTLRFESKHSFFARSWKSSNNSINLLQTLTFKHEFLQSWVRSGGGSKCDEETGSRTPFHKSLYSETIKRAIADCTPDMNLEECTSVTVKGTLYKKGHIVILKQLTNFGDMFLVGVVHLILVDSCENILFLVKQGKASFIYKYGAYKVKMLDGFECVKQPEFLSYYPHFAYVRGTETYFTLRHAIVNQCLDF